MHRRWAVAAVLAALIFPAALLADPGRHGGWPPGTVERYFALKGGGLVLDGLEGAYFGLEGGTTLNDVLDLGLSIDWFRHRDRATTQVLDLDPGFQPPLRAEVTAFESGADFVPFGVTVRLRVPLRARLRPYVSGTIGYEILYLQLSELQSRTPPYDVLLGRSETLYGAMWQAAAGIAVDLGRQAELLGEVGMHSGSPSREARLDGVPVDLRADLDGAFVRAGVRIRL